MNNVTMINRWTTSSMMLASVVLIVAGLSCFPQAICTQAPWIVKNNNQWFPTLEPSVVLRLNGKQPLVEPSARNSALSLAA